MSEYLRPTFAPEIYHDEHGLPIDYGSRWPGESPPAGAYSHVSNLRRFAPLHEVAEALIKWLLNTFEVILEEDPVVATDLIQVPNDVVRAVRVVPSDFKAAPLTFVLTSFPGVYLHAGSLHDFHFPVCGCNACDDKVENLIEELEWTVRTVVSGGYYESFDPLPADWIEYRLNEPGVGMQSGRSRTEDLPKERVELARAVLPADGQWLPWQELAPDSLAADN